jgi:hypothetical protein
LAARQYAAICSRSLERAVAVSPFGFVLEVFVD